MMQQPTHIRSFVSQRGHITQRQKKALETLAASWCLPFSQQTLDFSSVFSRVAPTVLEIGFGMGETTLQIALNRPDTNFLCLEVFPSGVGSLLQKIEDHHVTNIRIIQYDAVMVLQHMIDKQALAGVHIYFPDPWPKKKHHKRRLIQPPFIDLVTTRLAMNGYIHCATDWEHYAHQMLEVLSAAPRLRNTSPPDFAPRPDWRPTTKFENRGLRLGHGVWDLIFTKHSDSV